MNVRFRFRPQFAVLCGLLMVLCCILGAWQWHRYTFKKYLSSTYRHRLQYAPINLFPLASDMQFLHVKVAGTYLSELTMLVQNSFHAERSGYEVLTPVQIPNEKKWLLVDRGWVEHWMQHPEKIVSPMQMISGYIKLINEYQFILGKNILAPTQWPLVMQKINFEELQRILQHELFPFILRLDPNQPNGFIRDWTVTNMLPERHLAYAIQWFSFALVILIGFICFCCEKNVNGNN